MAQGFHFHSPIQKIQRLIDFAGVELALELVGGHVIALFKRRKRFMRPLDGVFQ